MPSPFSLSPPLAPYYSGNPGPESKISPFWVMPPPEVGGAAGGRPGAGRRGRGPVWVWAGSGGLVSSRKPVLWFRVHLGSWGLLSSVKWEHNHCSEAMGVRTVEKVGALPVACCFCTKVASFLSPVWFHSPSPSRGQKSALERNSGAMATPVCVVGWVPPCLPASLVALLGSFKVSRGSGSDPSAEPGLQYQFSDSQPWALPAVLCHLGGGPGWG